MPSDRDAAGLPPYPELRWVTLQAMRRMPLPASNAEINEAVADALGLTADQRAATHINGRQTELAYRVAWARTALKVAGAVDNVGQAVWTVTNEGYDIRQDVINQRYAVHLAELTAQRKKSKQVPQTDSLEDESASDDDAPPLEDDWKENLLDRLSRLSPAGFERLAGRLMLAAGFHDVEVLGRSGDGGIDCIGMYRLSLVSFPTYVQCKRHKGSVGAGMVRDLRGAMVGRGDRGLLITTGTFTAGAQSEATRDGAPPIELIDGDALCDLLKQYEVGVITTQRTVEDTSIDQSYFDRLNEGQP